MVFNTFCTHWRQQSYLFAAEVGYRKQPLIFRHFDKCLSLQPILRCFRLSDQWMNDYFLSRRESLARRWMKLLGISVHRPWIYLPFFDPLSSNFHLNIIARILDIWAVLDIDSNEEHFSCTGKTAKRRRCENPVNLKNGWESSNILLELVQY